MQASNEEMNNQTQTHLGKVHALIDKGTLHQLRQMINGLRPVEISKLLESSPPASRKVIWELINRGSIGEVVEELPEDIRSDYLISIEAEDIAELTGGLDTDDVVDILQQLPEQITEEVLSVMSNQNRERIEKILPYPEDTAGGLVNTDAITIRPRFTLDVVLRYLRRHAELPPSTDALIVVNRKDAYLGILPISKILTSDSNIAVRDIMVTDTDAINANMPDVDVAKLFELHDWISAPVVDDDGILIGRITIDDVVDVIREDAEHSLMSMAGLGEDDDTFAPVQKASPKRALWLGINLITALLASSVIGMFQDTIEKVTALAVLMPIVASMGGVAGSQTLTLMIRGQATGQIGPNNIRWLAFRELGVSLINGFIWALIMGVIAAWWFGDGVISLIIASAMVINLITAALTGAFLPTILRKLNIDPALAGGVTLTTITDIVGFMSFLGLASYFYA